MIKCKYFSGSCLLESHKLSKVLCFYDSNVSTKIIICCFSDFIIRWVKLRNAEALKNIAQQNLWRKDFGGTTMMVKIFEKNSRFHVILGTTGNAQFLFFRSLLLVFKTKIREDNWALGYILWSFEILLIFRNFLKY